MEFGKGYSAKVDDRFSIHIAGDTDEEIEAIIKLNMEIHQDEVLKTFIRQIFLEYPRKSEILWLYIKDDKENELVSSICLVPLEWQIEDTRLPVCEMEFVGTLEHHRRKDFIKILNRLYETIMDQNGYILSVITGIPYFYRTLGYEFVSSLDERISIQASKIPNKKYEQVNIRKANSKDIPFIALKYTQFHRNFFIFNRFDPERFKFKYIQDQFNSEVRTTYIFEESSVPINYFSFGMCYDNQNFEIYSPDLSKREIITLLQFVKTIGNYNENDIIILSISEYSALYDYIISLGGTPLSTYGWQIKIPYLDKFLNLIKKIIENRVKNSKFRGLTKAIRISNYKDTIELDFYNGKIKNIEIKKDYQNLEPMDLSVPGTLLYKLILGDRTIDEINYIIKDALVNISSKSLIETIFPKKKSLFGSYI